MATVGRTTQGASVLSIENRPFGREVTFAAGDEVTSIEAWVSCDTTDHPINAAIYDTSGNRLALGTEQTALVSAGAHQKSIPISYTVPSGGTYIIAVAFENVSGSGNLYYDAGSAPCYYDIDTSEGYPLTSVWAELTGADSVTSDGSISATYTPSGGSAPTITNADDELFENGESITITGTGFGSTQGSGTVKLSPTDDIDDARAVTQTVTAWGDTSITMTAVRGALPVYTNLYLFVENDSAASNASGYVVQLETTPIGLTVTYS